MRTVIFRTYPRSETKPEYYAEAERLMKIAVAMPGFIASKFFTASDGEEVTIVEFESDAALNAWRQHPDHVAVQKNSSRFFSDYRITVFAEPERDYGVKDNVRHGR
ncbi:MAG: antibiotic biosynthesis monooxygenase [Candidatus Binataceae bacterium]|nr:antibiotic biosynthesis monooxygenase [Candidatus Binataceae bacterium]